MRKHVPLDAAIGCTTADEPIAERREIAEIVAEALAPLPQCEREAVEAYAGMSDESCRQVAIRYGVVVQTVCNRAKAAIAKLRPQLAQLEGCL
jgi:DNA-directed RNA polymerase specialized sigma subunit